MSNSAGPQLPHSPPHAARTCPFAGMGRRKYSPLPSVIISRLVRCQRKSSFIAGDVQRNCAATAEAFYQPYSLHALLARVVPESTENQPGLNSGLLDASLHSFIYSRDHGFWRDALFKMEQRRKTKFGINQVISRKLLENVLDHESKR